MSLTMESVLGRLQTIQNKQPAKQSKPVMIEGRTFRQCSKCGKQGWHPQATAEICCGAAMELIEKPAMTVADYVAFIGCPKAYASGAISHKEMLEMMERDHIKPLPGPEKARSGDSVRPL